MDLEKQLHNVQTEMYMYQNSQKQNYNDFLNYRYDKLTMMRIFSLTHYHSYSLLSVSVKVGIRIMM